MASLGGETRRILALTTLALVLAGVAWWVWRPGARSTPSAARDAEGLDTPRARLVGRPETRDEPGETPAAALTAEERLAALAGRRGPTSELRVVDRFGVPVDSARVTFTCVDAAGRLFERTQLTWSDGTVPEWPPSRPVVSLRVVAHLLLGGEHEVIALEDPQGIPDSALGDLRADLLSSLTLTVADASGLPLPRQPLLVRIPGADGQEGVSTNEGGRVRLAPLADGSEIEVAGTSGGYLDRRRVEGTWQPLRVHGGEARLVLGDTARLRLAFGEAPPPASLTLRVTDARASTVHEGAVRGLEHGIWTAPHGPLRTPLAVFAAAFEEGRFARLVVESIPREPIHVRLAPGVPLSIEVACAELPPGAFARAEIVGRGFRHVVEIPGPDLRRRIVLPDEDLDVRVERAFRPEDPGRRSWTGWAHRHREAVVRVVLRPRVRISGRVLLPEGTEPLGLVIVTATGPHETFHSYPDREQESRFAFEVPPDAYRLDVVVEDTDVRFRGTLDLGDVRGDVSDLVLPVTPVEER